MRICKDIYLRTSDSDIRISISKALMGRIKDPDSAVSVSQARLSHSPLVVLILTGLCQELARKTFEEIWVAPLYPFVEGSDSTDIPAKAKQMVNERLNIMIRVIHSGSDARSTDNFSLSVLLNLIQSVSIPDGQ